MLRSSLQVGRVLHRRAGSRAHSFEYPTFMSLLDLDELSNIFDRSRWWSIDRPNLLSFYRRDYLHGASDLKQEVKRRILADSGSRFEGRVLMLAHLRYLGYCFNPVSFYFCYGAETPGPDFILAEINNTPWNERHCYVLDCRKHSGRALEFEFGKQFHVSPFMPMDLQYRWRFILGPENIGVFMSLWRNDSNCFQASLKLESRELSSKSMLRIPAGYPLQTALVTTRIYWQAFLLWAKRVPFHPHPKQLSKEPHYEHHSKKPPFVRAGPD